MDDNNMAVNDTIGEEANPDTTPVPEEQATEEVQQPEVEVATETEGQETETVESKKGASARIRELNERTKKAEERAQSLEERIAELTQSARPVGQPTQAPQPQEDELNADGTVNADAFRNRVLAEADARAELKIRQYEAINRINSETNEVMRLNPELDPESDKFNKELSDAVTEAVENGVRANPYSSSPKAIATRMMKLYKGAVAKEAGQASENIAKQVSQAALRPTSVRKTEKSASEKSIAELEQELGVVIS